MTTRRDLDPATPGFDRLITSWFDAESDVRAPSDLLDRTIARTTRLRPRSAWLLPERWIPMEVTMRQVRLPRLAPVALIILLVLVAAIALAIAGSRPTFPAPFGPAANGVIVYAVNGDIVTLDPRTGVTTAIVAGGDVDREPAISRDGERIAFVRKVTGGDAVFVVDTTGAKVAQLTSRPYVSIPGLSWSPDGSTIAFVSADRLWMVRTDGSGANVVQMGDIATIVDFSWRPPDGRELILAGKQGDSFRLFAVNADGTGLRRISDYEGTQDDYQWVTTSPDGLRVAYGAFPAKQIHVVVIDEARDQVVSPDDGVGLNFPRWSPDGARIAVLQVSDGDVPATRIGVFSAGDVAPHLVLTGPTFEGGVQFDWSPDGSVILANQWDTDVVWLLDPKGGPGTQTSWQATLDSVAWQRKAR